MKSSLLNSRFLSPEEIEWQDFVDGQGTLFGSQAEDQAGVCKAMMELQQANRAGGLHLMLRSYEVALPLLSARQLICRLPLLYTLRSEHLTQSTNLRSARRANRRTCKLATPVLSEALFVSFWPLETGTRPNAFPFTLQRPPDELKCQPVTLALLAPSGDVLLSLSTPLRPCRVERLLCVEQLTKVRLGHSDRLGLNASALIKLAEKGGTGLSVATEADALAEEAVARTRWERVRQSVCKYLRRPQMLEKCRAKEEVPNASDELAVMASGAEDDEEQPPPMQEPTSLCRVRSVSAEAPPALESPTVDRPRTAHAAKGLEAWQRIRSVLRVHDSCLVTYCGTDTLKLLDLLNNEGACAEARVLQVYMAEAEAPMFIVTTDARQTSRILQMLTLSFMYKSHMILPLELAGEILERSEELLNATRNTTLLSRLGTRRKTTIAAARLRVMRQASEPAAADRDSFINSR